MKKSTQGLEPNGYGAGLRRKLNTPWTEDRPKRAEAEWRRETEKSAAGHPAIKRVRWEVKS
jgi:hypothetical protein